MWHVAVGQRPCVDSFADDDAGVGPQPPVELAAADIERNHARRIALEQDVGEPAGRRADVQRPASGDDDGEHVERVGQLDAAAPDVGMIRGDELDLRLLADRGAGFRDDLSVDFDLAGKNQRARALARRRQPALDERDVQSDFLFATTDTKDTTRTPRVRLDRRSQRASSARSSICRASVSAVPVAP